MTEWKKRVTEASLIMTVFDEEDKGYTSDGNTSKYKDGHRSAPVAYAVYIDKHLAFAGGDLEKEFLNFPVKLNKFNPALFPLLDDSILETPILGNSWESPNRILNDYYGNLDTRVATPINWRAFRTNLNMVGINHNIFPKTVDEFNKLSETARKIRDNNAKDEEEKKPEEDFIKSKANAGPVPREDGTYPSWNTNRPVSAYVLPENFEAVFDVANPSRGGITATPVPWVAGTSYPVGSLVTYNDGLAYLATTNVSREVPNPDQDVRNASGNWMRTSLPSTTPAPVSVAEVPPLTTIRQGQRNPAREVEMPTRRTLGDIRQEVFNEVISRNRLNAPMSPNSLGLMYDYPRSMEPTRSNPTAFTGTYSTSINTVATGDNRIYWDDWLGEPTPRPSMRNGPLNSPDRSTPRPEPSDLVSRLFRHVNRESAS